MFEELKIKSIVRKVANESRYSYDDKVLMYIDLFEHEPKKNNDLIKRYISEFSPIIWQEFNEYITIKNMTDIVKKENDKTSNTLDDMIRKLK